MASADDKAVIQAIKNGEIDRFEVLVKKYTKIIQSYINSKLFEKADVDDLVQNSFLSFYKAIDRFDEDRPVLPYLYEIAKNEMRMYFRSYKTALQLDETIQVEHVEQDWGEEEDVVRLLDSLSEEQKKALQLVYEGYSYEDIARRLKKPLNTIRTIIRRARLALIKKIKP